MFVSKDKIVYLGVLGEGFSGKSDQEVVFCFEGMDHRSSFFSIGLAPGVSESHEPCGGDDGGGYFIAGAGSEDGFEASSDGGLLVEGIAVCDEEFFALSVDGEGLERDVDAEFLGEVVGDPQVVVAGQEGDGYSLVGHLGELSEGSGVSFGYDVFPFEEEVEDIADQEEFLAVVLDILEPLDEISFSLLWCLGAKLESEVYVGCEVDGHGVGLLISFQ